MITAAAERTDLIVCPYLGLADDPRTHFAFATMDHRCHSRSSLKQIEITHQVSFCLSANYPGCRRYIVPAPASAPAAGLAVVPGRAGAPLARVNGSVRQRSGPDGRRGPVVRAAVLVVAVVTLAIVAAWFLSQGGSLAAGPAGSPSSSPAAGLASPTLSPQPTSTSSPPPTSAPPTSVPTTRPTANASPPTTHVVVRGETLSSIASLYGVPVAAIQAANGIKDPNYIAIGQRLIIPAP